MDLKVKKPEESVVRVRTTVELEDLRVTRAPGTWAPVGSVTVPLMAPVGTDGSGASGSGLKGGVGSAGASEEELLAGC
jgi:hypothetical protein